jgi:hypothetical protein
MSSALIRRFIGCALLLTAGCSSQQAMLSEIREFNLLPPSEGPAPVLLKQKISLQSGQRSQQFLTIARFGRERLKLVVLLPSGQRLLTLDYDGKELTQQSLTAFDLPGGEILAIMQVASWPEASLRTHYPASEGWHLEVSPDARQLLTESGTALTISYSPGVLRIDNYLKDYRVIVETLEKIEL